MLMVCDFNLFSGMFLLDETELFNARNLTCYGKTSLEFYHHLPNSFEKSLVINYRLGDVDILHGFTILATLYIVIVIVHYLHSLRALIVAGFKYKAYNKSIRIICKVVCNIYHLPLTI